MAFKLQNRFLETIGALGSDDSGMLEQARIYRRMAGIPPSLLRCNGERTRLEADARVMRMGHEIVPLAHNSCCMSNIV